MNTLIIIGNGFDLAHDLPTSYGHFLDDFWSKLRFRYEEPLIRDIIYVNPEFFRVLTINTILNFDSFIKNLKEYSKEYG
uniref:AbiH family protein n=1 Tax=Allomuricauda sp. CP2A TaxID=1848189 RepID=UPI000AE8AA69